MRGKKIGILYSGGMDSAALAGRLIKEGYEVWPIYIQCELPWEKSEKAAAKKFLTALSSKNIKPLQTVRLLLEGAYAKNWSQTGRTPGANSADEEVFLPGRNLLLIIKALLALSAKNIWHLAMATLQHNPFPDATETFFRTFEKLLQHSFRHPIKISVPFRKLSKTQLLKANKNLPLHLSFSCINPQKGLHCGRCNKCAERKKAFAQAGVIDKTVYKNQYKP